MRYCLWIAALSCIAASAHASDVEGHWSTACNMQFKHSIRFTPDRLEMTRRTFVDSNCQTAILTTRTTAHYTLGMKIENGAKLLDMMLEKRFVTPRGAEEVQTLNERMYCGQSDWQENVEKEITGLNCEGQVFAGNLSYYNIVKVSSGRLYLGMEDKEHRGTSAENRPETLNTHVPYLKGP